MQKAKDFAQADAIRQSLLDQGVVLRIPVKGQFGDVLIKSTLSNIES